MNTIARGLATKKSARELGASFRPFTETLKDTIAWYRENGWIK